MAVIRLFAHVDSLLELLTKSKSLHILLVLDRKGFPNAFFDLKRESELFFYNGFSSFERT